MRRLVLCLLLLLIAWPARADDPAPPLPAALVAARTVYVVNQGVDDKVWQRCLRDLRAWGRLALVGEPTEADVTLTLSPQPQKATYNWATGQNYPVTAHTLTFTGKDTTVALYGATFRRDLKKPLDQLGARLEAARGR